MVPKKIGIKKEEPKDYNFAATIYLVNLSANGLPGTCLKQMTGGADRDRTGDLMNAIHALYQLSYSPTNKNVYFKNTQIDIYSVQYMPSFNNYIFTFLQGFYYENNTLFHGIYDRITYHHYAFL